MATRRVPFDPADGDRPVHTKPPGARALGVSRCNARNRKCLRLRPTPAGRPESAFSRRYRAGGPFGGAFRPPRSPFPLFTAHHPVYRLGGFGHLAERAWLKPCVERSPLASRSMELSCVDLPKVARMGDEGGCRRVAPCRSGLVGQTGVGRVACGVRMIA